MSPKASREHTDYSITNHLPPLVAQTGPDASRCIGISPNGIRQVGGLPIRDIPTRRDASGPVCATVAVPRCARSRSRTAAQFTFDRRAAGWQGSIPIQDEPTLKPGTIRQSQVTGFLRPADRKSHWAYRRRNPGRTRENRAAPQLSAGGYLRRRIRGLYAVLLLNL